MTIRYVLGVFTALFFASSAVAEQPEILLATMDKAGRSIASKKCLHPSKIFKEPFQNKYEPSVADEIQTYTCLGFIAKVYIARASNVTRELPMQVIVTQQNSHIPKNLSVGSLASDIRAILGAPLRLEGSNMVYSLNDESTGEDTLTFTVSADKVRSVAWIWDVD